MKKITLLLAICLSIMASAAHADIFTVNSSLQGWVTDAGVGNGASNGNNTFTGNENGLRFNSWAYFTLPTLSSAVTSVTLSGNLAPFQVFADETLEIFDVNTLLTSFSSSSGGVAAYTDLRSGNQYGAISGHNGPFSVTLSGAIFADLLAASGGEFIIGFTNATQNLIPSDPEGDTGIYTNGDDVNLPTLVINTAAVPEPETYAMMLAGLGLMGFVARRRKENQA